MNTSDSNFCVFPRYTHIRSRMRDWWTDFASPNGKVYLRQTVNHYNPKNSINATQAGIFFSQLEFFVFFKLTMTTYLHSAMSRCSVAETQVLPQSVQTGSSTSGTVRKLQKQGPRSLIPEKIGVLNYYLIPWRTCLVLISAYFERFSRLITKTQLYSVACTLWRCVSVLLLGDVKSVRGVPLTTCDELTVDTFSSITVPLQHEGVEDSGEITTGLLDRREHDFDKTSNATSSTKIWKGWCELLLDPCWNLTAIIIIIHPISTNTLCHKLQID